MKKFLAKLFTTSIYWMKKIILDVLSSNGIQKFSLNRIMILVWFIYLVKLLNKAIQSYGAIAAPGTIISIVEPTFAVTVFLVLLSYEFGKKTQLNIKGHEVQIDNTGKEGEEPK